MIKIIYIKDSEKNESYVWRKDIVMILKTKKIVVFTAKSKLPDIKCVENIGEILNKINEIN